MMMKNRQIRDTVKLGTDKNSRITSTSFDSADVLGNAWYMIIHLPFLLLVRPIYLKSRGRYANLIADLQAFVIP